MEKIVIDANIVIAVFDRQDSTHKQAVLLLERFKESGSMLIMLNLVIYEILTVLHMKGYRKEAHGFYRLVHSDPRMRIVYLNADLESRAYYNFQDSTSKNMSFTDCAIITVAEIVNADSIVSFDAHIRRRSKVVPVFNGTE